MKKILFVLSDDLYCRNYIKTNVLDNLSNKFKIYYIADQNLTNNNKKLIKKKNFLGFYNFTKKEIEDYNYLNWKFSFIYEKKIKSTSLKILNKNYLNTKFKWSDENKIKILLRFPYRIFITIKKNINYFIYKNFGNEVKILDNFKKKNPIKNKIFDKIKRNNPDLIVVPTQGNRRILYEVIRISKILKKKTLHLCDNWDNPSSRKYIPPTADYLGVWGKQSMQHGIKFNNFNKDNIFILGSPRYENYFRFKKNSHFNFKYFLLLENYINHDIDKVLIKIDDMLENNKIFENFKLIYRPHPNRKDDETIDINKFKHVILDPQLEKNYKRKIFDARAIPSLEYIPSLIRNAELIIAGPTTMIIESLFFKKKILILGYPGKNYFNFHNFIKDAYHLRGLKNFKNIKICNSIEKISTDIKKIFFLKKKNIFQNLSKKREFYLFMNKKGYKNSISNCFQKILTN